MSSSPFSQISSAKAALESGHLAVIPTETVYGLAASIDSESALRNIFSLKARPFFDPLIVHIGRFDQLNEVVGEWGASHQVLAQRFWPGPLTIVVKRNLSLNSLITSGLDSVGVRMPAHPFTRRLLRELRHPVAAPSANRFGKTSPTQTSHVRTEFPDQALTILEGGPSQIGIESTVVRLLETATQITIDILRPGMISPSEIRDELKAHTSKALTISETPHEASPGHLKNHYQPDIPLVVSARPLSPLMTADIEEKFSLPKHSRYSELILHPDPKIAARELYQQMRQTAKGGAAWILVRRTSDRTGELWHSIWNRLEKAASYHIE
jgi:L-threonylcarbamoyladenylate synthase